MTELRPANGVPLEELAWDTDVLRVLIADCLDRCGKGPADLLKLWRARRGMKRHEFVGRVHQAFFQNEPLELWRSELCSVAHAAFSELLSMTRTANFMQKIGPVHLQRWLRPPGAKGFAVLPSWLPMDCMSPTLVPPPPLPSPDPPL